MSDLSVIKKLMDDTMKAADEYLKSEGQYIVVARGNFDALLFSIYATAEEYKKNNMNKSDKVYEMLISFKTGYELIINHEFMKKMGITPSQGVNLRV